MPNKKTLRNECFVQILVSQTKTQEDQLVPITAAFIIKKMKLGARYFTGRLVLPNLHFLQQLLCKRLWDSMRRFFWNQLDMQGVYVYFGIVDFMWRLCNHQKRSQMDIQMVSNGSNKWCISANVHSQHVNC